MPKLLQNSGVKKMKSNLGFIKHFPKDYTKEKYIVFPQYLSFSVYLKKVGCLPVVLLENEIDLELHDKDFLPFKVNVFDRKKFTDFMLDSLPIDKVGISLKINSELDYIAELEIEEVA